MLLAVLHRAINRLEESETENGWSIPAIETGRNMSGREDLDEFLASQWHLLKLVGHQLRNRIGGARKDELERILEYNR